MGKMQFSAMVLFAWFMQTTMCQTVNDTLVYLLEWERRKSKKKKRRKKLERIQNFFNDFSFRGNDFCIHYICIMVITSRIERETVFHFSHCSIIAIFSPVYARLCPHPCVNGISIESHCNL